MRMEALLFVAARREIATRNLGALRLVRHWHLFEHLCQHVSEPIHFVGECLHLPAVHDGPLLALQHIGPLLPHIGAV